MFIGMAEILTGFNEQVYKIQKEQFIFPFYMYKLQKDYALAILVLRTRCRESMPKLKSRALT